MAFFALCPLIGGRRLRAHLQNALGLFDGAGHLQSFVDGMRHRLLAVDVLTLIHSVQRDARVPMIGRGDNHRVDVVEGQHFAIVEITFDAMQFRSLALALLVDIANCGDAAGIGIVLAKLFEGPREVRSSATDPHYTYIDNVVCADDMAGRFRRPFGAKRFSGDTESGASSPGFLQEVSAIKCVCHGSRFRLQLYLSAVIYNGDLHIAREGHYPLQIVSKKRR